MAYTVPHTWVAGDFLRASWLNLTTTDLVDHEARIVALEATGTGNVTGQASSVDSEIALFSSTTGKVIKRATGTGYVKVTSGVYQTPAATIPLATDVSGDLPFANLTQGSALSVLGVTGNATADHASIAAASDHQVLRRSGTALTFGAVNLAQSAAVTGILPFANLPANMAQIFKATVTLTDAQIKALPTTPISIVPASGSGTLLKPLSVNLKLLASAGGYTNVNAVNAELVIEYAGADYATQSLANDNTLTTPITYVTDFFAVGDRYVDLGAPYLDAFDAGNAAGSAEWVVPPFRLPTSSENKALELFLFNNGSGNLTGGNAANTLRVVVIYMVL